MTVQKLLDRLAHVADKTKLVVASCSAFCVPVQGVEDTKEGVFFIELEEVEHGDQ